MKKSKFAAAFLLVVILFGVWPVFQPVKAVTRCDWVQFVADVTVPDGTAYKAGTVFTKTWRIKNIGTCTWSTDYSLAFVSGTQMGGTSPVKLPNSVAPGSTIDLTVSMTAPSSAGTYQGNWELKNASGVLFGIGSSADKAFWVLIKVSSDSSSAGYDFAANASSATWTSGAGTLSFPGTDGDAKGFVKKLDAPKLENGTTDSLPGLLMVPQNVTDGYIQGIFPAYHVSSGDRFQTTVNCEYNATSCWVNFRLQYQIGSGAIQTFWSFNEKYEGNVFRANLDLSRLAGQDVKFILRNNAAGTATGDRALWGSPRIVGSGTISPTFTPTATITGTPPTPTKTPTATPGASTCDKALFVADVTVPDGSSYAPGATFIKTWRIKNVGTCTWTTKYNLVFVSGEKLGGSDAVPFTSTIAPNTTFDISVNLTAPSTTGSYRGYWQFKNEAGQLFGIGSAYNKPFWVDIKVTGGTTVTPVTPIPSGTGYDFATNASSAVWTSGAGTLSFPGTEGDARGYALKLDSIAMETGSTDARVTLLTFPQNVTNGYIQAQYPPIALKSGDRFQSTIGCQAGYTSCYVNYKLNYQIDAGTIKTFWSFTEKYEGQVFNVNLDLSSLAGQNVKFYLVNSAYGSPTDDRAAWINPRITSLMTPTPTPTTAVPSTNTMTPTPTTAVPSTNTMTPTPTTAVPSTNTMTPTPTTTP